MDIQICFHQIKHPGTNNYITARIIYRHRHGNVIQNKGP